MFYQFPIPVVQDIHSCEKAGQTVTHLLTERQDYTAAYVQSTVEEYNKRQKDPSNEVLTVEHRPLKKCSSPNIGRKTMDEEHHTNPNVSGHSSHSKHQQRCSNMKHFETNMFGVTTTTDASAVNESEIPAECEVSTNKKVPLVPFKGSGNLLAGKDSWSSAFEEYAAPVQRINSIDDGNFPCSCRQSYAVS